MRKSKQLVVIGWLATCYCHLQFIESYFPYDGRRPIIPHNFHVGKSIAASISHVVNEYGAIISQVLERTVKFCHPLYSG